MSRRLLALVLLLLLAAGCGGAKSPSVANVVTTTRSSSAAGAASTGGGSGSQPTQDQMQQDALKYSQCMRSNGVSSFPDPSAGGGFEFQAGSGVDPSSPAFQAAQSKCRKVLPGGGPPGPGTQTHPTAQALAQMVQIARCMRGHGISGFPDPTTTVPQFPKGGGVISIIDGVVLSFPAGVVDQQSPAFIRAAAVCKFPLHNH